MVTTDEYQRGTGGTLSSRGVSDLPRSARRFLVSLWTRAVSGRLKVKSSSYDQLTVDQDDVDEVRRWDEHSRGLSSCQELCSPYEGQSQPPGGTGPARNLTFNTSVEFHRGMEEVHMATSPGAHAPGMANVSGFAALGLVDTPGASYPEQLAQSTEMGRRNRYYHESITDLQDPTSSSLCPSIEGTNNNETQIISKEGKTPSTRDSDHGSGLRFDDEDWQLYHGKRKAKSKKKRKKKVVVHKAGDEETDGPLRTECYEELVEEIEVKRSKKKKRRRVTSKKVKNGAKKAGKVAWRGTKFTWKCLKYGLIYFTNGPGAALNVGGVAQTYMTSSNQRNTKYGFVQDKYNKPYY